jgi:hypothetical protein
MASQDPCVTAKIVNWIMEVSDPNIPKFFKLSGTCPQSYSRVSTLPFVYAHESSSLLLSLSVLSSLVSLSPH